MINYNFKTLIDYETPTAFPKNALGYFKATISSMRCGDMFNLEGPVEIYFEEEDTHHRYPKVRNLDNEKFNGLLYTVPSSKSYDVFLIYYVNHASKKTADLERFSMLAYNSKTDTCVHEVDCGNSKQNDVFTKLSQYSIKF